MNYNVTKYPHGTFSWANLCTTNQKAAKDFYTGLFEWTAQDMMDFSIFSMEGRSVAGTGPMPPYMHHGHSFWASFVTVNDLDEVLAKAAKLGAKITGPAMDVPPDNGRMGSIEDPEGAYLMFWQPKKVIGAGVVNKPGAMSWNELYSRDSEKAKKFYGELLGWTFEPSKDADGKYNMIKNNGRLNGGIMPMLPEMGSMPANWMVYFTVSDLSNSLAKVKELGGQVHGEKPISIAKIGMVTDPNGAGFILMQMSIPPAEWVE